MLTLKFYTAPMRLLDVINIENQNVLSCIYVLIIFYRENMMSFLHYVTATLRTLCAWRGSYLVKGLGSQRRNMKHVRIIMFYYREEADV